MLREGDLVYLLDEKGLRHWATIKKAMIRVEGLGVVDGSRLVGKESGSRISVANKTLWVLRPGTPELMESIERGPQVIGRKDAATIVQRLDLKCGDLVIEGGVGSGSLTTALLNAIKPEGKVVSVELREEFAAKAKRNIMRTELGNYWELRIGDVRTIKLSLKADAVVLDIPDPWEAVDNITVMMKGGGRFCAYVPNMNQVESTVTKLRVSSFAEIDALENIQRAIEVHPGGVRPSFDVLAHTGYIVFARKTMTEPEANS